MSMPEDYRNKFVAQLHNALSGFTGLDVDEAVRYAKVSVPRLGQLFSLSTGTPNKASQKRSVSR